MCDDPRFIAPGFFYFARYRKDFGSSDSVKIFSEDFKQCDKMVFQLV